MICKYIVVSGITSLDLEKKVNNHLAKGWILVGGVAVSKEMYYNFFQAMKKIEPTPLELKGSLIQAEAVDLP